LLTTEPEQESRLKEWLRAAQCPDGIRMVDLTATLALLEIQGPLAQSAVAPAAAARVTRDSVHNSTLLASPATAASDLWASLLGAGAGSIAGGHYAQEALRIALGIPRLGQDATLFARTAAAAKLRTLTAFASPLGLPGFGAHEVVVAGDEVVGELTSRAWVPGWPALLSLALVRFDMAACADLEFFAAGRRWPLTPRPTHWQRLLASPMDVSAAACKDLPK
jgi:hypothetical protein